MCISPRLIQGVAAHCRTCWQCRSNRISDWVGRCLAEAHTSTACHSVTLTYGRDAVGESDHPRAAVLTYSDVQGYLKRLRAAGHPVRYLVAGEYGERNRRAHWHALLFWQDGPPDDIVMKRRFHQDHWPHGFSFFEPLTEKSVRYVCKYILKSEDTTETTLRMSKKPPLGAGYIREYARRIAQAGLPLRKPVIQVPATGEREYYITGASLDILVSEYLDHVSPSIEHTELIDRWLDKRTEGTAGIDRPLFRDPPKTPAGQKLRSCEKTARYYYVAQDGRRYYYQEDTKIWRAAPGVLPGDPLPGLPGSPLRQYGRYD